MAGGIGPAFPTKNQTSSPFVNAPGEQSAAAKNSLTDYLAPATDNTLGQSSYDFTYRAFPPDLGEASYNGNYMVININVQRSTDYAGYINGPDGRINTFTEFDNSGATGEVSKLDALRGTIDKKYTSASGHILGYGDEFLPRYTKRIKESIAIYMPNTVQFDTNNIYEDVSLTGLASGALSSGAGLLRDLVPSKGFGKVLGSISGVASAGVGIVKGLGQVLQAPINPRVEVLFSNTALRNFQYDFLFAPESPQETRIVNEIIRTLRFHAAPETNNFFGTTGANGSGVNAIGPKGFSWTPPSEFDITFYNRGLENLNIPRINTCALVGINIDYAPSGTYSTFSGGAPVSVRMQLSFREISVIDKLKIMEGF